MSVIGIEMLKMDEDQEIEVEVRINEIEKQFHYRVEIFYGKECPFPKEDRVECIRNLIKSYDSDWDLAHIGAPNDDYIPITFWKKRNLELDSDNFYLILIFVKQDLFLFLPSTWNI